MFKPLLILNAAIVALSSLAATPALAELYCPQVEQKGWNWSETDFIDFGQCMKNGSQNNRDIDGLNDQKHNLLSLAIKGGASPAIISQILSAGADPNLKTAGGSGFMPLYHLSLSRVSQSQSEGILRQLLEAGADPNVPGPWELPMFYFAMVSSTNLSFSMEKLDLLLEHGADYKRGRPGMNWIGVAVRGRAPLPVLKRLYKIAPKVDQTPTIHMAAQIKPAPDIEIFQWLIGKGADVTAVTEDSEFVWDLAYKNKNTDLALFLKKAAGPDFISKLSDMVTDAEISAACRTSMVESMLRQDGATVDEVCGCVEENAALRWSRITQHPNFNRVYGKRDRNGKIEELVRGTFVGCLGIWSYTP